MKHGVFRLAAMATTCLALGACGSGGDQPAATTSTIALPDRLQPQALPPSGTLSAFVSVDGGARQALVINATTNRAEGTLTVTLGSHSFLVEFEFADAQFGTVLLASASQTIDVTQDTNLAFAPDDYLLPNDDADAFNNLSEIESRTDPASALDTPLQGQAVYTSDNNNLTLTFELFSATFDGVSTTISEPLVTNGDVRVFAVSPDGRYVAYQADKDVDERLELYVVEVDGSNHKTVSNINRADADVSLFSWSPDSARVAYRADQNVESQLELYTVFPDGTGLVEVSAPTAGSVVSHRWSPDGGRIAYVANGELFVADADGANHQRLSNDVRFTYAWSPDGTRILFDNSAGVSTVDASGTAAPVNVSGVLLPDQEPFINDEPWTPDGSRVAIVVEDTAVFENAAIYTVRPDGSDRQLVSGAITSGEEPFFLEWAPDSSYLLYWVEGTLGGFGVKLVAVDGDGANSVLLTQDLPLQSGESILIGSQMMISPDSTSIVYEIEDRDDFTNTALYTVKRDGSANTLISTAVLPGEGPYLPQWSPDSARVSYLATDNTTFDDRALLSVGRDGDTTINLSGLLNQASVGSVEWSPDGARVLYTLSQDLGGNRPLFVALADGSTRTSISQLVTEGNDVISFEGVYHLVEIEVNDSLESAKLIAIDAPVVGSAHSSSDPEDFYRYTARATRTHHVSLSSFGPSNNLDLRLLDRSGNLLGSSTTTTGRVERVAVDLSAGETILVQVSAVDTLVQEGYRLRIH